MQFALRGFFYIKKHYIGGFFMLNYAIVQPLVYLLILIVTLYALNSFFQNHTINKRYLHLHNLVNQYLLKKDIILNSLIVIYIIGLILIIFYSMLSWSNISEVSNEINLLVTILAKLILLGIIPLGLVVLIKNRKLIFGSISKIKFKDVIIEMKKNINTQQELEDKMNFILNYTTNIICNISDDFDYELYIDNVLNQYIKKQKLDQLFNLKYFIITDKHVEKYGTNADHFYILLINKNKLYIIFSSDNIPKTEIFLIFFLIQSIERDLHRVKGL